MGCFGQWSKCPNGDEYEMKCYHAEEEYIENNVDRDLIIIDKTIKV